jgi:REP element-mobilizing transposase RayT
MIATEMSCVPTGDGYPLGYFITFRCYGTWLHGDARGSVDLNHNTPGEPLVEPDRRLEQTRMSQLKQSPVTLNEPCRVVVDRTIHEVCEHRDWELHACNVRSNHVHVVVSAESSPEKVMNALKSWSTRRLRETKLIGPHTKPWSRHGSTKYLWNQAAIQAACLYTEEGQGENSAKQELPPGWAAP